MNRIFKMSALLAGVALLVTGCFKVDIQHAIKKDGSSHVVMVNDVSALENLGGLNDLSLGGLGDVTNGGVDTSEVEANLDSACDDFYKETTLVNPNCVRDGYVITMEGDTLLTEEMFTVKKSIPYITYSYNAANVFSILGDTGGEQSEQLSSDAIKEAKAGAELVGMELNYTINMPGTVVSAAVGEIDAETNTVTMDVFELVDQPEALVTAQALNWMWLIITGGILVVLVLVVVMVLMVMMKRRKKASAVNPAIIQ